METELVDLSVPSANADDLTSTNIPDDQGEQTWPTEEEMASAPGASTSSAEYLETEREMLPPALPGTTPKRVLKKVPRGTSAYQAAWIIDEDDEDVSGDEEESQDEDDYMTTGMEEKKHDAATNVFDDETASVSVRPFADLSPEAEAAQLASYLQARALERHHQSLDDASFPDEVDTPLHIPARERFARYRGMKSFRTSPWDAYEGLPEEYGKCFEVKDWKGMGRKMEDRAGKEGVEVCPFSSTDHAREADLCIPTRWERASSCTSRTSLPPSPKPTRQHFLSSYSPCTRTSTSTLSRISPSSATRSTPSPCGRRTPSSSSSALDAS